MISKIKNIIKLLRRTSSKSEIKKSLKLIILGASPRGIIGLKDEQEPTLIVISPGCGRGGSRKTKLVINDNDLSEKNK